MMRYLIQCCVDIVAHVVHVVQVRDVVPHIVPSVDTHVVVILVLGLDLDQDQDQELDLKVMMKVLLKVVEVYSI